LDGPHSSGAPRTQLTAGNEAEVGEGIAKAGVPRDQFWITSKLFELHHHPEHVSLAIKDTLKNLGLEYLDLYLLHWNVSEARAWCAEEADRSVCVALPPT
jgi:diketogulonate reductase-like aldo/keto reductase